MTGRQIELLLKSFEAVKPISMRAARLFYERLFQLEPSLRRVFRGNHAEPGKRMQIGVAVGALRRLDQILPAVANLDDLPPRGGRDEPDATVSAALQWTLTQVLGDAFTSDVRAAWIGMYATVTAVLQPEDIVVTPRGMNALRLV